MYNVSTGAVLSIVVVLDSHSNTVLVTEAQKEQLFNDTLNNLLKAM